MPLAMRKTDIAPEDRAEAARLEALDRYDILDTPREEAFDRVASLAKLIFGVESTYVSLIDGHRQYHKAQCAVGDNQLPIEDSLCRVTVRRDEALIVPDASKDERFKDSPLVTGEGHLRFYAGVPLTTPDGFNIGTLCAADSQPREFSAREQQILEGLARVAMSELELRQLATTDGLTGVMTRRAFREDAERFVALAKRHRSRLGLITFDIDHFKRVNDTYGHAAGDQVLAAVTEATTRQLRKTDAFGRLGGEEFAVLLPDADGTDALEVAEKLRHIIRGLKFPGSKPPISVTASFGVASFDPGSDDLDSLLVKADESLYDAKRTGRNRSVLWNGSTTSATVKVERRRVLKAGTLVFNERRSSINCTVRSLWATGAEVEVSSTLGIPEEFTLIIKSDGFEWPCTVAARREKSLELAFDAK